MTVDPSLDQPGGPVRILVVEGGEGDPSGRLRAVLAELASDRYTVERASGWDVGRARALSGEHDLHLIDQQLDEEPGIELLDELRASGRTTPVIVCAAHPTSDADLAAMRAGADDYLIAEHLDATLLERRIRYAVERRRRLEEQVREGEKLEALGTVAGAIAHNFNNLLTVVLGNAALLSRRLPEEPATRELLNEIQQAAHHGASLSREMLVYADRDRGTRFHHFDLSALITDMRELLEIRVGERALLHLDLAPTGRSLLGDPAQVRHLLLELAANAGEAMQPDRERQGTVTVRTRMLGPCDVASPPERPDANPVGRRLLLEIGDNGAGMDTATRQRAFDPFFTTRSLGRGLGLSAAFGIVRAHTGTIDIRSAPDTGTTIRIVLPAARAAPPGGG